MSHFSQCAWGIHRSMKNSEDRKNEVYMSFWTKGRSNSQGDKEYMLSEQMFAGPSSDNGLQENFD